MTDQPVPIPSYYILTFLTRDLRILTWRESSPWRHCQTYWPHSAAASAPLDAAQVVRYWWAALHCWYIKQSRPAAGLCQKSYEMIQIQSCILYGSYLLATIINHFIASSVKDVTIFSGLNKTVKSIYKTACSHIQCNLAHRDLCSAPNAENMEITRSYCHNPSFFFFFFKDCCTNFMFFFIYRPAAGRLGVTQNRRNVCMIVKNNWTGIYSNIRRLHRGLSVLLPAKFLITSSHESFEASSGMRLMTTRPLTPTRVPLIKAICFNQLKVWRTDPICKTTQRFGWTVEVSETFRDRSGWSLGSLNGVPTVSSGFFSLPLTPAGFFQGCSRYCHGSITLPIRLQDKPQGLHHGRGQGGYSFHSRHFFLLCWPSASSHNV